MTNKLKEEFIRQKCIEANPSIKDLVNSCKVQILYGEDTQLRDAVLIEKDEHIVDSFPGGGDHQQDYIPYEIVVLSEPYYDCPRYLDTTDDGNWIIKEIIGREIRLADVLLATREKVRTISILDINRHDEFICNYWNLLKDSLSDQSPETIDFIFNLLQ